jgi:hypothetical protein
MEPNVTPQEAHAALAAIDRGRLRVVDEIDLPQWYLWGLALSWIGLGLLADLATPWVTTVATFIFGAVHSTLAPRAIDGRHRSSRLSVRHATVGRHIAPLVIGSLILLAALTVAGSLAVGADGARHPVAITSVFIALIIVLGAPRLFGGVRRHAARTAGGS